MSLEVDSGSGAGSVPATQADRKKAVDPEIARYFQDFWRSWAEYISLVSEAVLKGRDSSWKIAHSVAK
eukprot:12335065-Prorocentrum_lima.AAC.1